VKKRTSTLDSFFKQAKKEAKATYNKATGWLSVEFPAKPSRDILTGLKSLGFGYKPRSKRWSGKWTFEREQHLKKLAGSIKPIFKEVDFKRKAEWAESQALKHQKESAQRYDQFRKELKTIPMGQPILVGHHSEKAHRAHLRRVDRHMAKSIEEKHIAVVYGERAKRYKRKARGESPGLIYRRIRKLEAEKRKCEKWRAEGYDKERYTRIIKNLDERLNIERKKYKASGGIAADKLELKKGDLVRTQLGIATVVKVNPKTVTVQKHSDWKLKLDKSQIYGKVKL